MASFYDVANGTLMYTLVIIGILFVLCYALVYLRKSWRRAKELGYDSQKLGSIVRTSIVTAIVPSIAIIVGFFSLAAIMGIPWPWWRLSVVGSVTYELMAADLGAKSAGVSLNAESLAQASANDFILIMFVMTICIIGGLITSIFLSKKLQAGTMKMKEKDARWGGLGNSTFMLTIMVVFTLPLILKGRVSALTWLTSLVMGVIIAAIIKATGAKWLNNFVLAICLIGAMAMSVVWTNILG